MFTSSWSNPQQNQQQQQQTGAFGQPSTFGSTNPAFGSTSAFGQPQQQPQQQQPQVNPMFGNLGTTPSTNTNTGFGAFSNTSSGATTGAFGAKPASGFGAFGGGTGAFGGGGTTSVFGQPAANPTPATTSVFGQPAATTGTTSAFGGTSSLFGGGSKFGTTSSGSNFPVVTTGTANPPFAAINEKDGNLSLQFQSISCMPQYIGYSFEELRVQDYAQGRKTASTTGAFGQPAFGQSQPASTGLFGAQTTQQPTTSLFGAATNTNTTNTGFGAFGQSTAQQPVSTSQGIFGNSNLFGQTQPQQQQQPQNAFSSTGAFGQPAQQTQQQTSIFSGGGGAFGAASKPAFTPFGGGGGTGAFGTANTQSAFGSQQQQPQQTATTGLFGSTQPAASTTSFGGFGSTANKPSIFGTPATTQPATSTFSGAFGNTNQQQQQPSQQQTQQPSLFGSSTTTNLFGQPQPQPQQQQAQPSLFGNTQTTTTPSLFTSTNTGTNLFGTPQQNQQQQQQQQQQQPQQQGSNLFGNIFNKPAQPAAPSLFGGLGQPQATTSQTQTPSLFSNTFGSTTQTNPLFGSKPAAPQMGSSFSNSQGMGMSTSNIFGGSVNTPAVQGTLTASIAQPIGENLPIFSMLPPGPRVLDNDQNAQKKKAGYFLDMPTRSPIPRVQLGFTPANSKLRGFGSVSSLTSSTSVNAPVSFTSGKPGALALNRSEAMSSSIGPDFLGRSGSPALGSGNRHSVKKVILEKKVEPAELFVKSGSPGALRAGKVTFSPALSIASREKEAALAASALQMHDSPTPASRTQSRPSHKDLLPAEKEAEKEPQSTGLDDGDYWVQPDLPTLKKKGYDELSAFSGLVVGRKGYGEIHFLEPVDLTGLPKLGALFGEVVKFDDKECSVYPDSEDVDKPPPGSGLNVKAKIILERCWALDKATREPIMDPTHPTAMKHLKRLKNMKDTHFESFDMKTGTWTFTVDHF